ncbi:MAG TPA: riboflavin kinase, partial [Candidatus Limnocylindria bacterium]|nr:riboflavin kinase [Candidatus Limnocylindria bacterium]
MTAVARGAADLRSLPAIGPAAICMGVFDGVHRGHQALLGATVAAASELGAASVALVFDPHPDEVIHPGTPVPRLAPPAVVVAQVQALGVDHALLIRFDAALRERTAEEFLGDLSPAIALRALIMTPESAFGHGRGGTVERMREHGRGAGFEVHVVEPVLVDGAPVSSTRLRLAVADGNLAAVTDLSRPAYLQGTVVEGDHRGRELGYPTANLRFDYVPALPPLGVYTGRVSVPDRGVGPEHPALVSIGTRPTFHDKGRLLVEVHLLDYDGDLYGAVLDLELLHR